MKIRGSRSAERNRPKKRRFFAVDVIFASDSRPITHSYYRWKKILRLAPPESPGMESRQKNQHHEGSEQGLQADDLPLQRNGERDIHHHVFQDGSLRLEIHAGTEDRVPNDACELGFLSDLTYVPLQKILRIDEGPDYLAFSEFGSDSSCCSSALSKFPREFLERTV
ncbi:hypothetical protein QJS10_CPB15g01033 [Acorus calamus]|uniref:Uncharacterized protein n=1 Tax=Acorus calamus TaxID=4465 RepID=A0AAV9D9T3_ACOCL|nr:hypothetical protein QJS10_CPB15g01033 [Acorus calamus]